MALPLCLRLSFPSGAQVLLCRETEAGTTADGRHGANVWDGGRPEQWLDFSANLRPEGPPEWVMRVMQDALADTRYYPDRAMTAARQGLAAYARVPEMAGLGLLDMTVAFERDKRTVQTSGVVDCPSGWLAAHNGLMVDGYEIHAGRNTLGGDAVPWLRSGGETDSVMNMGGNVLGSNIHGLFDDGQLFAAIAAHIRSEKGASAETAQPLTMAQFRQREFDRIADIVRASLDMDAIYRMLRGEV